MNPLESVLASAGNSVKFSAERARAICQRLAGSWQTNSPNFFMELRIQFRPHGLLPAAFILIAG